MVKSAAQLLILALALAAPASAFADSAAAGNWTSDDGKLTVKIFDCGDKKLCAEIAGLAKPLDKQGKPKLDAKNPNPALRSRPLIGTPVFQDMKQSSANKWVGKIYYTKDGNTYNATAKLSANKFVVSACWAFICKKFDFERVQ